MKIRIACLDQELLWVIDDVIDGLYSIDIRTFETKCVIDFRDLFSGEEFKTQSLIKWKEDYIIIIPQEIDKSWIFYNKATKEIERRKIIKKKCKEILVAIAQDRSQLYFCPVYINDPILIVDSDTLMCLKVIENWSDKMLGPCPEGAWTGAYSGQYFFYPQRDTKILVRLNCETQRINLLELDIPENVIAIDYAFGELWVLPIKGNKLYRIDENGQVDTIVELSVNSIANSLPDFARIIVQKRYLFLLPCYRKGIYVYDKLEKKIHIISEEKSKLEEENKETYLTYWEYCVMDNKICFLPFQDKHIEIDLSTLEYRRKDIFYPDIWPSNQEKKREEKADHIVEQSSIIRKNHGSDLEIFLYYIQRKENTNLNSISRNIGKDIWKMSQRE